MLPYIVAAVGSFLLGSIPFGWLIAKFKGIDIKKQGSGNIGATNVYRVIGKKEGALTLLLDLLKGSFAVALFSFIYRDVHLVNIVSALAVVLGHDYSVFLLFKGGKGVATSYGSTLVIYPLAALSGMFIWILILLTTKYSSLAALLSFLIATLIALSSNDYYVRILFLILYILMIYKHRENIRRLFRKEESRVKI
ncbi:glycerol-3-phosphate 1-O-acyltransferase PlsY [Hippea alviniae]|uniref:glycerol-3-phosphate 1-O-acyltransferase PlsY n=1 Tax=Hippea alviniae TaxID=1279027 RepID=UPI0003B37242|nr:glycerol-3-phosphate 1-O-acyltransferase PlsY [Hippea alviniae]